MCIIVYLQEYCGCTDVKGSFKLVRNTLHGGEGVDPHQKLKIWGHMCTVMETEDSIRFVPVILIPFWKGERALALQEHKPSVGGEDRVLEKSEFFI